MEFYFPLKTIRPQTLRSLFRRHVSIDGNGDFSGRLEKLVFSSAAGFMKGYMDLVFQHQDQFYLVDWKSNYLGPTIDDYRRDALQHTMQENYYILQYHLYVLALCQYLRLRKPGFRYESDFGGVFYLFIRGVTPDSGSEKGVYFDRPKPELIHALGNCLIPGYKG